MRLDDLMNDVMSETALEWPLQSYADAARACENEEDRTKLRALCDDLETAFIWQSGLGGVQRLARDSSGCLRPLQGRLWREILTDTTLSVHQWECIRTLARVYLSRDMDATTRRTAMILEAVAQSRLMLAGVYPFEAEDRRRIAADRKFILERPYLPDFVASTLKEAILAER